MAPIARILLASGAVLCFVRIVVCQLEPQDARDHVVTVQHKYDHSTINQYDHAAINYNSNVTALTLAARPVETTPSNGTQGRSQPLGFDSNCSGEGQCDEFLGLTCTRNLNSTPRCACATSTPVRINEDGVHRCVRAKNVNEACITNEECSFRNRNVLCKNSLCKCSYPYVLTAAKLCLIPSSNGNDKFTIALIVALTVAVLLLAAVYACGKTVGQRDSSSSSSRRTKLRRKRRRNTDASTSSSTTCIVAEDIPVPDSDNDRVFLAGDNETGEAQESRRQPRAPHRGSCLRDSSIPRRHSSRFISQRPAKTRKMADAPTVRDIDRSLCEGDDELELHLSSAFPAKPVADPHTTSLQRTFKGQRLRSQARRTTGAEVPYDEPDEGSLKGVDGLGFKDEQVQRVIDKHQVVVTVEVHEPRNVGESPKSPHVVPPSTRDFPQPEFVEDLQPSHSFDARLSDSLISTTASLASAELLYVDAAAAHCNAGQVTPEEAASKEPTFAERFLSDDEKPANTAPVQPFIADQNLDTATTDSSAKAASSTDSGIAGMTAHAAKTSSDVTSTCVMPYEKILLSFTKMKATSTDSDDTSRETARALLVFSDSNEGSIPPSGSVSLSFVSSNSSSDPAHRVTDLADLPRLQNNMAAANNETGDGSVVRRLPLPRLTSAATQTENSRQQALSLTERGTQVQELPEWPCYSGWPLFLKAPRSDIGPRGTTDRPWTEDMRNVVMQGNKNYLHQHARRRHQAKSATTLDETECVLFKLADEVQPDATSSSVAPEVIWSTTMSSDLTREGCESELRMNTISSVRDIRTVASDSSFEQPLKLTELILLQHPEVGLRGFFPFDLPGATNAQDGAERHGMSLKPNTSLEPALQLNTVLEDSAAGPLCKQTFTNNSSLNAASRECQLEPEGEDRRKETAETAVERLKEPSQPVIFLPDCSVAIRLPGGAIQTVHQGKPAFSCASPQMRAAIRLGQKSHQVVRATALDEPTFECVYNSILQPPPEVTNTAGPSAPVDAANPVRATFPARTVSFDMLTTVMSMESSNNPYGTEALGFSMPDEQSQVRISRPHSKRSRSLDVLTSVMSMESSNNPDDAEALGISQVRIRRPLGSRSRSLSTSIVAAATAAPGVRPADLACGAAVLPGRSDATATNSAGGKSRVPGRPAEECGERESRAHPMTLFFSFEDTFPDMPSWSGHEAANSSLRAVGSQRSDGSCETDKERAPESE